MSISKLIFEYENNIDRNNLLDVLCFTVKVLDFLNKLPSDDHVEYYKFIIECELNGLKDNHNKKGWIVDSFLTCCDVLLQMKELGY